MRGVTRILWAPTYMVERVDVVSDVSIGVDALLDSYLLEAAEEGLFDGVVPAIACQPIKKMIEQEPSFGYRTVAGLLHMNKNTVQRIFQLNGW